MAVTTLLRTRQRRLTVSGQSSFRPLRRVNGLRTMYTSVLRNANTRLAKSVQRVLRAPVSFNDRYNARVVPCRTVLRARACVNVNLLGHLGTFRGQIRCCAVGVISGRRVTARSRVRATLSIKSGTLIGRRSRLLRQTVLRGRPHLYLGHGNIIPRRQVVDQGFRAVGRCG